MLYLRENRLSGHPARAGQCQPPARIAWATWATDLTVLGLEQNQLTGEIPAELGNLVNLYTLLLAENQLTGCAPAELEAVPDSDLYELGLPICEAEADPPAEA